MFNSDFFSVDRVLRNAETSMPSYVFLTYTTNWPGHDLPQMSKGSVRLADMYPGLNEQNEFFPDMNELMVKYNNSHNVIEQVFNDRNAEDFFSIGWSFEHVPFVSVLETPHFMELFKVADDQKNIHYVMEAGLPILETKYDEMRNARGYARDLLIDTDEGLKIDYQPLAVFMHWYAEDAFGLPVGIPKNIDMVYNEDTRQVYARYDAYEKIEMTDLQGAMTEEEKMAEFGKGF